jgi:hypothetical protein
LEFRKVGRYDDVVVVVVTIPVLDVVAVFDTVVLDDTVVVWNGTFSDDVP